MSAELNCWKTELADDMRTFFGISRTKEYITGKHKVYLGKRNWFNLTRLSVRFGGVVSNKIES